MTGHAIKWVTSSASHGMGRPENCFRTLDTPTDRRARQCSGEMADNAAKNQTKLRSMDNLLQHRHLRSSRYNSVILSGRPIIVFCNCSLRNFTLEQSNLSPMYQSFQQTSIAPRNSTRMPHSPLTPTSPT